MAVAIGIQLADILFVWPFAVVNSAPSNFELAVSGVPAWDFAVAEDPPSMSELVALIEVSVDDGAVPSAPTASSELDTGDSLSEAVGFALSDEAEFVLSWNGLDYELFLVDFIVCSVEIFD